MEGSTAYLVFDGSATIPVVGTLDPIHRPPKLLDAENKLFEGLHKRKC